MGIFNQKSKFKPAAPTIRKEVVVVDKPKPKPKPKPRPLANNSNSLRVPSSSSSSLSISRNRKTTTATTTTTTTLSLGSPAPSSSDEKRDPSLAVRKRKLGNNAGRPSPASDRVAFGRDSSSDDDSDWEAALDARKRQRRRAAMHGGRAEDLKRRLAAQHAPEELLLLPGMIHAAEVASLAQRCVPVLGALEGEVGVELQYPGSRVRERYELVWGKEKIDAVKDIKMVVKSVAEIYLSDEEAKPFLGQTNGLVRQLERASSDKVKDLHTFKAALADFNTRLLALLKDGAISKNLEQKHNLPSHLVAFILDQVYDRTVAPKVELLLKYENGSDNVYGELLHPFVTDILTRRANMTSDQVFVDLGSGVGNVVLQAALEIGCESWGCEMMENACNLAEAQKREFAARCRLWGITPGAVNLERGDFRANARISEVLKRADVVLVNNQAFTSQLNDDLVRMFLDLKAGCKIVSLKSFVHDHKSVSHNINDVGSTILDVEDLTYPEGYVSWTGAAGTFCISTRRD